MKLNPIAIVFPYPTGAASLTELIDTLASCPQSGWQALDVGSVATQASHVVNDRMFIINFSGADMWNDADEFYFVYKTMDGKGEIVVRIGDLVKTDQWAKSGVLIRESFSSGSKNAFLLVSPTYGAVVQFRRTTGGNSTGFLVGYTSKAPACFLCLGGDVLTGFESADGITCVHNAATIFATLLRPQPLM